MSDLCLSWTLTYGHRLHDPSNDSTTVHTLNMRCHSLIYYYSTSTIETNGSRGMKADGWECYLCSTLVTEVCTVPKPKCGARTVAGGGCVRHVCPASHVPPVVRHVSKSTLHSHSRGTLLLFPAVTFRTLLQTSSHVWRSVHRHMVWLILGYTTRMTAPA